MARACVDGQCIPCRKDDECLLREVCVLDHCIRKELMGCRSRADCRGEDSLCVLSGYTSMDLRGNAEMTASCLLPVGGRSEKTRTVEPTQDSAVAPSVPAVAPTPQELVTDELRNALREEKG